MIRPLVAALAAAFLLVSGLALADTVRSRATVGALEKMDPAATAVLDRLRAAQKTTTSMMSTFRQTKEDDLFAQPSVQSGRFTFQGPDKFRWDYEKPEHVIVLVTKDSFKRWLPEQKLLRQMDLSKNRRRVFNYFGIGSDVDVLARHFEIKEVADDSHPGTKKLELRGKRRRVQKRLALLEMWIDDTTSLPSLIKVTMADGGTTQWEFGDMMVNPTLSAHAFDLELPKGTIVQSEDDPHGGLMDEVLEEKDDAAAEKGAAPSTGGTAAHSGGKP